MSTDSFTKREIVWKPGDDTREREGNLLPFMKKYNINSFDELLQRSHEDLEWFWDAVLNHLGIQWHKPYTKVLDDEEGIQWAKWFLNGQINIVSNCLDRYAENDKTSNNVCFVWESETGERASFTFGEIAKRVAVFANALKARGIEKGDSVVIYMPMIPEIVIAFFAVLKIGAIVVPVFSAYGIDALRVRVDAAKAKMIITTDGGYHKGKKTDMKSVVDKVLELSEKNTVKKVVIYQRLSDSTEGWDKEQYISWDNFIEGHDDNCETLACDSEDTSMILFTSGTTGTPKGTVHTHGGVIATTSKELGMQFDVTPSDMMFWVTDLGWMMAPWMIIGMNTLGGSFLIYEGAITYPDTTQLWKIIDRNPVTILGISPTAIRILIPGSERILENYDLSRLRILGTVGEPCDEISWWWYFSQVGKSKLPVFNISGGTEIMGCLLGGSVLTPVKPTSLSFPQLGADIDIIDDQGETIKDTGEVGHLVCRQPLPSMTKGFLSDKERYIETYWTRFENIWFHGDLAYRDEDGFWYIVGRSDDTIKVAGKRVGPAEIEGILVDRPEVLESGVTGVSHDIKGQAIVAYVVLKDKEMANENIRQELLDHITKLLGKAFRPAELRFTDDLPKTSSGKIMRRVLKEIYENGTTKSDLSTISNPEAIDFIIESS